MAATITEPEIKPEIIRKAIEYLKEKSPYNDPDSMFVGNNGSAMIGYKNAIHKLEKFAVEGGYDTDDYIEGYFIGT